MNTIRQIIIDFTKSKNQNLLQNYSCIEGISNYSNAPFDRNYENRKNLILELYQDFSIENKPLIKWLIQQEIMAFSYNILPQTTDICAFMLYKFMDNMDVYDLYNCKFGAGSDHQFSLDIELVFGLDKEKTKQFLTESKSNKKINKQILNTIKYYENNPDAKFKNREDYITYFQSKKINGIKADIKDFFDN